MHHFNGRSLVTFQRTIAKIHYLLDINEFVNKINESFHKIVRNINTI